MHAVSHAKKRVRFLLWEAPNKSVSSLPRPRYTRDSASRRAWRSPMKIKVPDIRRRGDDESISGFFMPAFLGDGLSGWLVFPDLLNADTARFWLFFTVDRSDEHFVDPGQQNDWNPGGFTDHRTAFTQRPATTAATVLPRRLFQSSVPAVRGLAALPRTRLPETLRIRRARSCLRPGRE